MKNYYVYILRCSDNKLYTGITNDYKTRITQHQEGMDPLCFTYKRRPVELVYLCDFTEAQQAISWEKQIKRWSKKKKEALISGDEAKLIELSRGKNYWIHNRIAMVRQAHHDNFPAIKVSP